MTLKIFVLGGNGLLESAFKLSKAGGRSLRSPRICVCHVEFILAATSWKSSRIISRRFHRRKRSFSRGPTDQLRPSYRPGPSPKLRRRDPRTPGDRQSVVEGKSVSVRVEPGCRRFITKHIEKTNK